MAREGAVLNYLPEDNTFILYGGVASEPMKGIAQLKPYTGKWDLITKLNYISTNQDKLDGRYGL